MVAFAERGSASSEGPIEAIAAADGFAVGRGLRFVRSSTAMPLLGDSQGVTLRDAIARVRGDLERLLGTLPRAQADLFEPEAQILDELVPRLLARDEEGQSREDAVVAETSCGCTDLVVDLRLRLLHALESSSGTDLHAMAARQDTDLVLLTDLVTPTLVASLPSQVTAIIAGVDGELHTRRDIGPNSHAAILAKGRGLPIVYLRSELLASMPDRAWVIVEAREGRASVCVDPNEHVLETAQRRLRRIERERLDDMSSCGTLAHLGVEVRVNVASPNDNIPDAADGVGLVRT